MNTLPEEATRFLALFPGRHTLQTFDDRPQKDIRLSRVLHNPAELAALNAQGAGVFLMVNEGDGQGRKVANVTRVRAYCADFDGAPLPQVWPLEPSMTVETSLGKFHAYWILGEGETVALDSTVWNFEQEAIARAVGSQPNDCKGLNRVMRVPGFQHQKGKPFTSRIVSITGQRFTLKQIQAAFSLPVAPTRPAAPERPTVGSKPGSQTETRRKYALTALHNLADELSTTVEGERNNKLNAVSFRAGRLIGGGHLERGEVGAELTRAAQAAGLTDSEVTQTLSAGLSAGMTDPDPLEGVGNTTSKRKSKKASSEDGEDDDSGGRRTPAGTRALEYAQEAGAELWHDQSGNAYMTATANGHRENYRLPSRAARDYVQALYWGKEKRTLNGQAQAEALGLMEALVHRQPIG